MHAKTKQEKDEGTCVHNITNNQGRQKGNLHKRIPKNAVRAATGHNRSMSLRRIGRL